MLTSLTHVTLYKVSLKQADALVLSQNHYSLTWTCPQYDDVKSHGLQGKGKQQEMCFIMNNRGLIFLLSFY